MLLQGPLQVWGFFLCIWLEKLKHLIVGGMWQNYALFFSLCLRHPLLLSLRVDDYWAGCNFSQSRFIFTFCSFNLFSFLSSNHCAQRWLVWVWKSSANTMILKTSFDIVGITCHFVRSKPMWFHIVLYALVLWPKKTTHHMINHNKSTFLKSIAYKVVLNTLITNVYLVFRGVVRWFTVIRSCKRI